MKPLTVDNFTTIHNFSSTDLFARIKDNVFNRVQSKLEHYVILDAEYQLIEAILGQMKELA